MKTALVTLGVLAILAVPLSQAALSPATTILQVKQMSAGLSFQVVLEYQGDMKEAVPEFYVPATATDATVAVSTPRFEKKVQPLVDVGTVEGSWSGFEHWRIDFARFNVSLEGNGRFGLTLSYNLPNVTGASFASAMPTQSFAVFMDPLRQFSPELQAEGKGVPLVAQSLTANGQTFGTLSNAVPTAENQVLTLDFTSDSEIAGGGLAPGLIVGLILGSLVGFLVVGLWSRRDRRR